MYFTFINACKSLNGVIKKSWLWYLCDRWVPSLFVEWIRFRLRIQSSRVLMAFIAHFILTLFANRSGLVDTLGIPWWNISIHNRNFAWNGFIRIWWLDMNIDDNPNLHLSHLLSIPTSFSTNKILQLGM